MTFVLLEVGTLHYDAVVEEREPNLVYKVKVLALDGEVVAGLYGRRNNLLYAYGLGVCKHGLGHYFAVGVCQRQLTRLSLLGNLYADLPAVDTLYVGDRLATRYLNLGDLIHAGAEEAELTAARHRRRTEHIQIDAALILIGVEIVVVAAGSQHGGAARCQSHHQPD